uniref:Caspase a n=1 Tax=Mola mola TaxID=94237 RepID=A0A3Q3WN69_MOLML
MSDMTTGCRGPRFVDKVSLNMINQLLDDILLDGVVNNGERESIIEENGIRSDRARRLIDIVIKKGDRASRKLIASIQSRDPELYSELGLSCGQPAPRAAEPQVEMKWSSSLSLATDSFWLEKQNDREVKSIANRVALLITNIKFTNEKKNRYGAEKDEENMKSLLTNLGYEVVKHTNLTGKAIDEAFIEFSKHPKLTKTDSVVVVIMSHGKLGAVLGVDTQSGTAFDDEFPINNIYKHLGPENCPALLDKPKIIIIQACRGENIDDDGFRRVHKEKDFISLLSSTPDTESYRHKMYGSFLIQYVVEVFNTYAHKDDIEELFRKVMYRFEDIKSIVQMPNKDRCSLTKTFYFYPGLAGI